MSPFGVVLLGFAFAGAVLFASSLGGEPGALLFLLPWAFSRWYGAGRGRASHWIVSSLAALAVGAAVWLGVERASSEPTAEAALRIDGATHEKSEFTLHRGNVWVVPGNYRNFELRATVAPVDESTLEVRLRAPDSNVAAGISCFVGEDPRIKTSFARETEYEFTPIGHDSDAVRTSKPSWTLKLRVTGDRYQAFVDDVELASATDATFHAGRILLLAARGEFRVEHLEVNPVADTEEASSSGTLRAILAVILLAALVGAAAALLRFPLPAAIESVAFGAVPACVAILMIASNGNAAPLPVGLTWLSALLLGAIPWLRRGGGPRARKRQAIGMTLFPALAALLLAVPPSSVPRASALARSVDLRSWSGTRLEEGVLYLTHPALRARNPYLVKHQFGDTAISPSPRRDRLRILALHSGSVDWEIDVDEMCRDRDLHVELVDAGYPAATAATLKRLLRDAYLDFGPAVVMLDVENVLLRDARALDVEPYLAKITEPHYRRTLIDRWFGDDEAPRSEAEQLIDALKQMNEIVTARGAKFFVLTDTCPAHLAQAARQAGAEAHFSVFLRTKAMVDAVEALVRPTAKNDEQ